MADNVGPVLPLEEAQEELDIIDEIRAAASAAGPPRLKPDIDHLEMGTATLEDGTIVPLFDVGDEIVAERHFELLPGTPWFDTRLYRVKSIDDVTGVIKCLDVEQNHWAHVGYKHEHTLIKLAQKGVPWWIIPRITRARKTAQPTTDGGKPHLGRRRGSKNRPREVVAAEKQARELRKRMRQERKRGKHQ